jgi:hypothetical protein
MFSAEKEKEKKESAHGETIFGLILPGNMAIWQYGNLVLPGHIASWRQKCCPRTQASF